MINNSELLFTVDENNNPITPVARNVAHSSNVWHRTSHVWIINKNNEVLCQMRSMLKDCNPGMWEAFFGGHLSPDSNYLDHAVTELNEELGIKCDKKELKELFVNKSDEAYEFQCVYILRWDGDISKLFLEKDEVDQVKWFKISDLKTQMSTNLKLWSLMGYEDKFFKILENDWKIL